MTCRGLSGWLLALLLGLSCACATPNASDGPEQASSQVEQATSRVRPPEIMLSGTSVGEGLKVGEPTVTTLGARIAHTIVLNAGGTKLENSASYQRLRFDLRDPETPLSVMQSIAVSSALVQPLQLWSVIFVAAPSYSDDFQSNTSIDAFGLTLVAAATRRFSPRFEVGLGVAAQNIFTRPQAVPVALVNWQVAERLQFEALVPLNAMLTWVPVDMLGLRASMLLTGNTFHGDPSAYGLSNPQISYTSVAADAGVRWFIFPWLHLTLHGGYTLYGRVKITDGRGGPEQHKFKLLNGAVLGLDLGFG